MELQFRLWLEAIFDPAITQLYKWKPTPDSDKTYLGKTFNLKLDPNGRVVQLDKDDWSQSIPHVEISPRGKTIKLQKLSPQSPDFRKIINALRSKYHDIDTWEVEVFFAAMHQQSGRSNWNRDVAYWLRQNTVNLNNRLPQYFYHGTSTNQWYMGIKQKGLLPRSLSGSSGSYGAQNIDSLSQSDLVYLSTHPDAAAREAARQAARKHGGRPLILRISSSGLFPEKFRPDEDAANRLRNASSTMTAQGSVRMASIVGYTGRIGASVIQPFLIGKDNQLTSNNTIYCKWEPFHDVPIGEHPLTQKLKDKQTPYVGDAEYYALKDAGVIGQEQEKTASGWPTTRVVIKKDVDDNEVRTILKNAGWAQTVKAILKDLDDGYRGVLYRFKDRRVPDEISPEDELLVKPLLASKMVTKEKWKDNPERYYLSSYDYEDKAIELAKLLGRQDFKQYSRKLIEMLDRWDESNS